MNFLNSDSSLALLQRLVNHSRQGSLEWAKLGTSRYAFMARTQRFYYVIGSKDEDNLAPFYLAIGPNRSSDSAPLDRIESDVPESSVDEQVNVLLEELYVFVSRKVLGLEHVLPQIFEDLDELDGPF